LYTVAGVGAAFLGLSIHHIVLDGPSQQIVYGHLTQLLAAERGGPPVELVAHDEDVIARAAIAHHVRTLSAQNTELPKDVLHLELPFKRDPVGPAQMEALTRHVADETIAAAEALASRQGLTLNALLMGSLAFLLHELSGRGEFAIMQNYLGRGLDQLHTVGSFSTGVPVLFSFATTGASLRSTCKHVLSETLAQMNRGDVVGVGQVPSMAYELNDARPIPRPAETTRPGGVKLTDIFFYVNQFSDGYAVMISYDRGMYDVSSMDSLVTKWMEMWVGAL